MKNIVGECLCNVLKNKGEVYLNDKKKKAKKQEGLETKKTNKAKKQEK